MDVFHSFSEATNLIILRVSHLTMPRLPSFTHRDIAKWLLDKKMAYLPDNQTISHYQNHMQSVNNESIHSIYVITNASHSIYIYKSAFSHSRTCSM